MPQTFTFREFYKEQTGEDWDDPRLDKNKLSTRFKAIADYLDISTSCGQRTDGIDWEELDQWAKAQKDLDTLRLGRDYIDCNDKDAKRIVEAARLRTLSR